MQVIPQPVTQAQEKAEKPQSIINKPLEADSIIENNDAIALNDISSKNALSTIDSKEIVIRKKRQYNAFLRLIKKGKYTTGILTARVLGVDEHTISKWLCTPKVRDLMNNKYDEYISDIEKAKDWKAKAYLLDKLEGQDKTKDNTITLNNMIQVNTTPPTKVIQGTVTI